MMFIVVLLLDKDCIAGGLSMFYIISNDISNRLLMNYNIKGSNDINLFINQFNDMHLYVGQVSNQYLLVMVKCDSNLIG